MDKTKPSQTWLEKNKVNLGVAIGALLTLGAGIAYWSYRRGRYPDIPDIDIQPGARIPKSLQNAIPITDASSLGTVASNKPQYINKIKILREKVAAESKRGELDMNTIVLIHEALMDISEEAFGLAILDNRIKRRQVMGKSDLDYENLVVEGAEEIEKLITTKMEQVLQDCQTSTQLYERSCQSWANKNPQFAMMSILMIEKMKTKIPNKSGKTMSMNDAREMLKFQIEQYPQIKVNVQNK